MARIKRFFKRRVSYEPLEDGGEGEEVGPSSASNRNPGTRFSWTIYFIFLLLGIAMLWAWNMFMAAGPYFQRRFKSDRAILSNFQAAELAVSTVTNLGSVFVLAKLQANASYPRRITSSLIINTITFAVLALSTRLFLGVSAGGYLAFLMITTFATSLATGFMQNGCFAFVASYTLPEYMQAIMLGQGVAGVLPPIVQIVSVLGSSKASSTGTTSAFAYFLTAAGVSVLTLFAFFYLQGARPPHSQASATINDSNDEHTSPLLAATETATPTPALAKQSVSLLYLARQLASSATAVFLTFGITMVFPVFTQMISSTQLHPPPLLRDAAFIPLALLVWNSGDLLGRLAPLSRSVSLAHRPRILLLIAVARAVFVPLYLLCNIAPTTSSAAFSNQVRTPFFGDLAYLLIVQFPFGLSNGYLGSCCMMGAGDLVREEEREAAGGFMGLCLVGGLAFGSFCSFFVANG